MSVGSAEGCPVCKQCAVPILTDGMHPDQFITVCFLLWTASRTRDIQARTGSTFASLNCEVCKLLAVVNCSLHKSVLTNGAFIPARDGHCPTNAALFSSSFISGLLINQTSLSECTVQPQCHAFQLSCLF